MPGIRGTLACHAGQDPFDRRFIGTGPAQFFAFGKRHDAVLSIVNHQSRQTSALQNCTDVEFAFEFDGRKSILDGADEPRPGWSPDAERPAILIDHSNEI
jgi:hypothetical protein